MSRRRPLSNTAPAADLVALPRRPARSINAPTPAENRDETMMSLDEALQVRPDRRFPIFSYLHNELMKMSLWPAGA